jgi:DNA helicase HerA-like ATPase
MMRNTMLGHIISGSLVEGFFMRISTEMALEEIRTGKFVSIQGACYQFFSLITDLTLHVTHQDIIIFPPTQHESLLRDALAHKHMYATARLEPMLMLAPSGSPLPIKTIPPHFAPVFEATESDIARIFGNESEKSSRFFSIGTPVDMKMPICLDLEKLIERSNGIFGKTGTGKTFLTRLVLAGIIKNKKAVNVIFDMHSEYGLQARKEGKDAVFVKGLKTLFPSQVAIFSLDAASTRRRGGSPDVEIELDYQSVHVEDIISLQSELNLHATAFEAAYLIAARYKKNWLHVLLQQEDIKEFAHSIGAHPESVAALYRKLKRIELLPFFISRSATSTAHCSVIDEMIEFINNGISIIIEFGNFTSTFCYLLIANIITRRIHAEYIKKTEQFLGSQKAEDQPPHLMITIEEAHKFLNTHAAQQTIFGTIAREMRKYYVSLLIVDQRPSGIDQEIISQIGTKIVAQLHDEKDIQAVLTGISHAAQLRSILASLDSRKQALLLGHALPMPIVIQTREYDEHFYRAMSTSVSTAPIEQLINEMF